MSKNYHFRCGCEYSRLTDYCMKICQACLKEKTNDGTLGPYWSKKGV